ncbi:hypothetical protein [Rhizobium rhizogenes]|uniref:hypothetical protein n=1 Tax=Rhizobium rhizogenes TaxID=359 RepID=UPI0022C21CF5|nr:hypothetical protein [Rhizobium rhizogenes]MCZ7479566.1 hypothetical protein [Rhizobium rhizogenes]
MPYIQSDHFPLVAFGAFVLTVLLWVTWKSCIRPMFIVDVEIKRIADELVQQHGERAAEIALIEEDRAWRYSQNFEQGKWRRVRAELRRRKEL